MSNVPCTTATGTCSKRYANWNDFLKQHTIQKDSGVASTHTRIGSKGAGIYGGNYHVEPDELETMHSLYVEHVFVRGNKEYMTERQLVENGPILIDLDFQYAYEVEERQHTQQHIEDIIVLYLDQLKSFLQVPEDGSLTFPVYVMEKSNVRRCDDKKITKDGVHIEIGLQLHHHLQYQLRSLVLNHIADVCDLPVTNSWAKVLDEGIAKGVVNWPMYGSQKPDAAEAYTLTYMFQTQYDDGLWLLGENVAAECDVKTQFSQLSAQYTGHLALPLNKNVVIPSSVSRKEEGHVENHSSSSVQVTDINDIVDHATLQNAVQQFLDSLTDDDAHLRDLHHYTQILPEKYYEPGSHLLNRQVAFALKHTDSRMFLTWVMLRAKASDFDFGEIPSLLDFWKYHIKQRENGVTKRSILFWAKQDNPEEFAKVTQTSLDYYIEQAIVQPVEWNFARVLYQIFKDDYVCTSYKAAENKWFMFKDHRWQEDKKLRLRAEISRRLFHIFEAKRDALFKEILQLDPTSDKRDKLQKKIDALSKILNKLKSTSDKNNIIRETVEFFCDDNFLAQTDSNPYLMCFTNGVFDFKTNEFRPGHPQDYLTKCTENPYLRPEELEEPANKEIQGLIMDFLAKLFPQPSLRAYMFDHAASTLLGIKKEQVFNIYCGSGANGKSMFVELMVQGLRGYATIIPISMITGERTKMGVATPEIMMLKGARYAVSQEPRAGMRFNDGILKELTGGDKLTGRYLYGGTEEFIPQFSMALCTNYLLDVESNDDGIWRRMKVVDYISKFASPGEVYSDTTKYVFPKDKLLKEKLASWAPVFMSMLVSRVCETGGEVIDCPEVLRASNEYRFSQDIISRFIAERLERDTAQPGIKVTSLNNQFKEWFHLNYGVKKPPKLSEIEKVMDIKFGARNSKGVWLHVAIKQDEDDEEPVL